MLACVLGLASGARAQPMDPADPDPSAGDPVLSFDSPLGAVEYSAGRGLRFERLGLTLGGFTTLEVDREEHESAVIELDGLNFLVLFEPIDPLRIFTEIEIGNLATIEEGDGDDDVRSDPEAVVERLYADLSRDDALNLRLGKFQTPIGRWNLVPAEPFVWTASEPVLLERAFDEHQTGGALFGSLYPGSKPLKYWVYGQFIDPLDPDEDPEPSARSAGGRLEYGGELDDGSLGLSFLASEREDDWSFLGGLDGLLRLGPLELTSELAIGWGDRPDRDLWAVFLQGVYELGALSPSLRSLYLVGRYEHFDPSEARQDANLVDLGVTWIPLPYLNIKAGYRLSDRETEDVRRGITASVSVLF